MILYIAEKPNLGKTLATALPQQQDNGFIRLANGDIVSWCFGHLFKTSST
jgi:DNA topoisomerase III